MSPIELNKNNNTSETFDSPVKEKNMVPIELNIKLNKNNPASEIPAANPASQSEQEILSQIEAQSEARRLSRFIKVIEIISSIILAAAMIAIFTGIIILNYNKVQSEKQFMDSDPEEYIIISDDDKLEENLDSYPAITLNLNKIAYIPASWATLESVINPGSSDNNIILNDDAKSWYAVFEEAYAYMYDHTSGTILETETANIDLNNLTPDPELASSAASGSKPTIRYYISFIDMDFDQTSEIFLNSAAIRLIWREAGYDYNVEILVSENKKPDVITRIYTNGEVSYQQ